MNDVDKLVRALNRISGAVDALTWTIVWLPIIWLVMAVLLFAIFGDPRL